MISPLFHEAGKFAYRLLRCSWGEAFSTLSADSCIGSGESLIRSDPFNYFQILFSKCPHVRPLDLRPVCVSSSSFSRPSVVFPGFRRQLSLQAVRHSPILGHISPVLMTRIFAVTSICIAFRQRKLGYISLGIQKAPAGNCLYFFARVFIVRD